MTTSDYLTQLQQDRADLVDNLEAKGITGLSGDETFTELVPEVLNIPTGASVNIIDGYQLFYDNHRLNEFDNLKPLLNNIENAISMFNNCFQMTTFPVFDCSHITNAVQMFYACTALTATEEMDLSSCAGYGNLFGHCTSLVTVAPITMNTTDAIYCTSMFDGCTNLENVPYLNFSKLLSNDYRYMFRNCKKLTNNSLNNILASCASVSYTGSNRTLNYMFGGSMASYYPASTIQGLSNYQAFIDAGWTIGWN